MIDFTLYDYLEKIVSEQDKVLEKYQKVYCKSEKEQSIGINAVQSIVRRAVIDDQTNDPLYSWISYEKESYSSNKLSNIKIDMDFILSLLSNAAGVVIFDKWAIIMVVLTIFAQLRKAKVDLSPAMGIIVMFLYNNGYERKEDRSIPEAVLKENILTEIEQNIENINSEKEFKVAIEALEKLNVIRIEDGNIMLIEEVKI